MTNNIYKSPAVHSSEAVMLPAAEGVDMGARPRARPALDTIRRKDARMTAARQAQVTEAVPSQWIEPVPVHNEAQPREEKPGPWLGRAALRSITSGMPTPMPEGAGAAPVAQAQNAPPQISTRGALRSVVTDMLGGRGGQGAHFHPVMADADPQAALIDGRLMTDW